MSRPAEEAEVAVGVRPPLEEPWVVEPGRARLRLASAMRLLRSSRDLTIGGQTNFAVNHQSATKTAIWTNNVALMFTSDFLYWRSRGGLARLSL